MKPRRSQEERRATTIAALRQATIALLVEQGYANATASGIAARAGVSRGALLHHYSDKTDLVIDATDAMWDTSVAATRALSASFAAGDIEMKAFIEGLWERSFSRQNVSVTVDMLIAARGEPRLAAHLENALQNRLFAAYAEASEVLFAGAEMDPRSRRVAMTTATSLIRGLRLADMMEADPELLQDVRAALVETLRGMLARGGMPAPVAEGAA